ncbi:hypothetical protein ACFVIX_18760 [Bacillus subtilis]|uniref:hypothetical protein n=1 Tax=Bacillus subtilis TaxID=1423 RepID=UPI0005C24825|nr:hypothetical protein [Bacillus subtilis]MCB4341092.1 hypothetical protein [Bacillus subtilis]OCB97926.1 hypothetical protein SRCM101294_00844 [Bacillus amyloliquefaciens]
MLKAVQILCLVVVLIHYTQMLFLFHPSYIEVAVLSVIFFATGICSIVNKMLLKIAFFVLVIIGMFLKTVYLPFESFKEIVYVTLIMFALFSVGVIQSLKYYTNTDNQ